MAFRFRKSKNLIPGVRLNIGKRGFSVRMGGKGLGHTIGTSGRRTTVGVPGTGFFFTKKHRPLSEPDEPQSGWFSRALGILVVVVLLFYLIGMLTGSK